MICDRFFLRFQNSTAIAAGILAIAVGTALAAPALAVTSTDSFTVRVSEKQGALLDPSGSMMSYMARDLGFDRMISRNRPFLELTNDAASNDPISEFHLALGDSRFNFNCAALGACAMLGKLDEPKPVFTLASATSDGGDQLDLTIGNGGLLPGQTVRFRIALGFDAAYKTDKDYFATPDFRTVLFAMNGHEMYPDHAPAVDPDDPTANNAQISVLFGSGAGALHAGPVTFDNYPISGDAGRYYNNIYHAYGATDPVQVFAGLSGSASAVPEPGTIVLAAIGLLIGLLPVTRRFCRR
jgi:hypothetical protein